MAVLHLNQEGFDKLLSASQTVLVDFWATWCGPCKMLAPVIEELDRQYDGKAVIAKVDVDAEPELAMRYGVMSIPTVVLFQNGEEVERKVGLLPKESYVELLDQYI